MTAKRKLSGHLKYFSTTQAAIFLGLDTSTVKRMIDRGALKSVVIPGDCRWRRIPLLDLQALRGAMERELVGAPRETTLGVVSRAAPRRLKSILRKQG